MAAPKGNRFGAHDKPWTRALERVVAQDPDKLRRIAMKTLDLAEEGDPAARKEIADRLDGKPIQPVEMSGSIETREAADMTDAELARIAAGSSARAIAKTAGPKSIN